VSERTIFLAALDIADPAERLAYVDRACAGDAALRHQVETLLAAHERAGDFLDVPAVEQVAAAARPSEGPTEDTGSFVAGEQAVAPNLIPENPTETQTERPADEAFAFLAPSDKPGSLGRLGHYEVLELVGKGGMGVVFKAFDEKLRRVVAIKVLAPRLASSGPARQRFIREAQAAAAVVHEHVIDIHAVEDAKAVPYFVMQ
jgi:hypothetical protein